MRIERNKPRVFRGWFIVAACFLLTLILGQAYFSFGIFFRPLQDDLSLSRTTVSSAYTFFLIGVAISILVAGRLVDRMWPIPIVLATSLLTGAGISLCSQAHSINQLRACLLMAGMGVGPIWTVACSTVTRWFDGRKRAGLALAITSTGEGFGAVIFAPLANYLIRTCGWRDAFLYMGIMAFIIILTSALILLWHSRRETTETPNSFRPPCAAHRQGVGIGKIVTSPSFIGIALAISAAIMAFQALSVHLVPYATDTGIPPTAAAVALGCVGGFSILGGLMVGFISDAVGWQRTLVLTLFGMGLSMIWLVFLGSTWMLYCFVFLWGMLYGARGPAGVGILGQHFGLGSLGLLIGIVTAMGMVAGGVAPSVAGFMFDRTGAYSLVFFVIMAMLFGSALMVMAIGGRRPPSDGEGP